MKPHNHAAPSKEQLCAQPVGRKKMKLRNNKKTNKRGCVGQKIKGTAGREGWRPGRRACARAKEGGVHQVPSIGWVAYFGARRREAHSRRSWLGNGRNFNFKGTATCRGGGGRSFLRRPSIILPLRSPETDAPSFSLLSFFSIFEGCAKYFEVFCSYIFLKLFKRKFSLKLLIRFLVHFLKFLQLFGTCSICSCF